VSANLCEAIAQMSADEEEPQKVSVSVDWSAAWRREIEEVTFDPSDVRIIASAAAYLRQQGPFEDAEVRGYVRNLERGPRAPAGRIVIEGTAEGAHRNVYVTLQGADYRRAIDAHRRQTQVSVRGTLLKRGRHWELLEPGAFERVGPDPT
jgi:hypothetical protein